MKVYVDIRRDNWTALLLSLTPFLKNYKVSYVGVNLATLIFFALIIIEFIFKATGKRKEQHLQICFSKPFIIVMLLYMVVEYYIIHNLKSYQGTVLNNFTDIMAFAFIMYGLVIITSKKDVCKQFKRHIIQISCFMACVVIIQTVLFYLFGVTLSEGRRFLLPFSNMFEESVARYVSTSSMIINGLFRPSAFFLEPAHFAQYCSLALCVVVFENLGKNRHSYAGILISIGMILTTSGLGIALVGLIWGIKYLIDISTLERRKIVNALIIAVCLGIIFVVLYNTVGFFANAVNRVLIQDDNNAVAGRIGSVLFLDRLSGVEKIFGTGYKNLPWSTARNVTYYMTSIVEIQYCQGVVGLVVFIGMLLLTLFRMIMKKLLKTTIFMAFILFVIFIIFCSIISPAQLVLLLPFFCVFRDKVRQQDNLLTPGEMRK